MDKHHTPRSPALRIAAALALLCLIAAAIIVPLTKRAHDTAGSSTKLQIVAAENFWGDIASQIGGGHVRVTSIISDPETDPHLYESNATNASAIAKADVVITNGLGYDDFMDKLLGSTKNNNRQVLTAAKVLNVSGNEANPHVWYDIPRVHQVSDAMAQSFAAKDPAHKAEYAANAQKFRASLQPLIGQISTIKRTYPAQPVTYTERVAGYLLDDAGLTVKTPPGFTNAIENGTDPSPRDSQAMEQLLTSRQIRALLYNSQATSPVTDKLQKIAKENTVPIVGVTETLPPHTTYQSWQKSQLDALAKALATK